MQPELELVRQWLERARTDLRSAEVDLASAPPISDDACFHCQQAVEKTLKAFLCHHAVEPEYTHQIERLIEQCSTIDHAFLDLHEAADPLTTYAVRFRYPYFGAGPTPAQAGDALAVAQRVWQFVTNRLPAEVVP